MRKPCWYAAIQYDIPYLKRDKEGLLEAAGVCYVADVPPGFALSDKRAAAFVERVQQQQITVNQTAIRAELASLVYPLYFFDFETIDFAIPAFAGCAPYQQTPFQYSCHILTADGALTHCDFLHTTPDDPRRALAESLLAHIGPTGHLVAYNIPFERGVLLHLADRLIVTLPLGVLQAGRLTFTPALPTAKQQAIAALGMGVLNKCYLRFADLF